MIRISPSCSSKFGSQSGGALIYIFIGVILFAALALTFSRGMRSNTSNISAKTSKIGASEFVEYSKLIERATNKMLLNGASEADIGFTNSITTLNASGATIYSGNPNCSTTSCEVFDYQGGRVKASLPSSTYLIDNASLAATSPMAGAIYPNVVTIQDLGSASPDLVISFYGLKPEVCAAINDFFGVANPNGAPPVEDGTAAADQYKGSFTTTTTIF